MICIRRKVFHISNTKTRAVKFSPADDTMSCPPREKRNYFILSQSSFFRGQREEGDEKEAPVWLARAVITPKRCFFRPFFPTMFSLPVRDPLFFSVGNIQGLLGKTLIGWTTFRGRIVPEPWRLSRDTHAASFG